MVLHARSIGSPHPRTHSRSSHRYRGCRRPFERGRYDMEYKGPNLCGGSKQSSPSWPRSITCSISRRLLLEQPTPNSPASDLACARSTRTLVLADQVINHAVHLAKATTRYRVAVLAALRQSDNDEQQRRLVSEPSPASACLSRRVTLVGRHARGASRSWGVTLIGRGRCRARGRRSEISPKLTHSITR